MKPLSETAVSIKASTTLAVDSLAKSMKLSGLDVIGFGTGEPDFDTPDNIKAAGIEAIRAGKTKYSPAAGIPELRVAIADRLKVDLGLNYDYTQIVVGSGAKHNVFIALAALLNPGDEVVLPAPYWVTYREAIIMAGQCDNYFLEMSWCAPSQIQAAINAIGSSRVMFGADSLVNIKNEINKFMTIGLTDAQLEDVFYKTAKTAYNL